MAKDPTQSLSRQSHGIPDSRRELVAFPAGGPTQPVPQAARTQVRALSRYCLNLPGSLAFLRHLSCRGKASFGESSMLQTGSNAGNPKPRTTQNDLRQMDGGDPLLVGVCHRVFPIDIAANLVWSLLLFGFARLGWDGWEA